MGIQKCFVRLRLESASLGEEGLELARAAKALDVRVAANVLLGNVDVGDGALAGDLFECVLDSTAVGCCSTTLMCGLMVVGGGGRLTLFVKLDDLEIGVEGAE